MPIGQYIIARVDAGLTHAQAVTLATDLGGTLAAPTTLAENNLILGFLAQDDLLWGGEPRDNARNGPWLGLTQPAGGTEPGGGWTWDTGETYGFTAWHSGQPDNFLGDSYAIYWNQSGSIGWGDHINDPVSQGYGPVISAAVELVAGVRGLNGTGGHDFIWGGDIGNRIQAGAGDDIVQGNGGKDRIAGGSGNDDLTGGSGADTLTGGGNADHFIFALAADSRNTALGHDVITDFSLAKGDVIDLHRIDAIPGGAFDHLTFVGSAAFSAQGQVRAEIIGGETHVEVNLGGTLTPEMLIILGNGAVLDATAFVL